MTTGSMPRTAVVLVAAGSGTRVGAALNKVLLPLRGVPVLAWSLRTACSLPYVDHVVVVTRPEDRQLVEQLAADHLPDGRSAVMAAGGATRHASEDSGLRALRRQVAADQVEVVAVHDAARPLAAPALFDAVVRAAADHGGAVPGRPLPAVVSADGRRRVSGLVAAQTPQAFRAGPLLEAYARAAADAFTGTDTASCFAAYTDLPVVAVPAPATNLKITFPDDVTHAERLLDRR